MAVTVGRRRRWAQCRARCETPFEGKSPTHAQGLVGRPWGPVAVGTVVVGTVVVAAGETNGVDRLTGTTDDGRRSLSKAAPRGVRMRTTNVVRETVAGRAAEVLAAARAVKDGMVGASGSVSRSGSTGRSKVTEARSRATMRATFSRNSSRRSRERDKQE